tara:strand:+ start:598 stop:729 length:132 start_codon:yes stop_codon:yes gene_type:complete
MNDLKIVQLLLKSDDFDKETKEKIAKIVIKEIKRRINVTTITT